MYFVSSKMQNKFAQKIKFEMYRLFLSKDRIMLLLFHYYYHYYYTIHLFLILCFYTELNKRFFYDYYFLNINNNRFYLLLYNPLIEAESASFLIIASGKTWYLYSYLLFFSIHYGRKLVCSVADFTYNNISNDRERE